MRKKEGQRNYCFGEMPSKIVREKEGERERKRRSARSADVFFFFSFSNNKKRRKNTGSDQTSARMDGTPTKTDRNRCGGYGFSQIHQANRWHLNQNLHSVDCTSTTLKSFGGIKNEIFFEGFQLKEFVIDLINLFFPSIDHLQLHQHHREVFKIDVYARSQIYRFVWPCDENLDQLLRLI